MKKELVLKEWQADIIKDKSKIIMVNTSRGGSKTFILANKVIYEKPKTVLYISDYAKQLNVLKENFEEIFHSDETIWRTIKDYNFSPDELFIKFITGETVTVYNKNFVTDEDVEIDMALFDNGLPQLDIKAKKYISVFTINYPIMNLFNNRGDISYYAVGLVHLERGLFTRERIEGLKNELSPLAFMKDIDVCNDYNILEKEWKSLDEFKNVEDKPIRGLRAGKFIEESCNINNEDIQHNINKIDFKSEILKEKQIINKAVEEYNSVILDNLDNIEYLFKDYHKPVEISYDNEGYLELKIILKNNNNESNYDFRHIRNSGYENIINDTKNKLKGFITRIIVAKNIEI